MKVISLGWGCQSFALAAMSALGVLPKVDVAIHADTTHERSETYEFAKRWTPWLEDRGVRVVTVQTTPARSDPFYSVNVPSTFLPAFHSYPDGRPSGQFHRQCTNEWKIRPIRQWLQAHRKGEPVEQWLGITLDEVARMKGADVQYITNGFPFIETLSRPWTRGMAIRWLLDNGLEVPVKSACVFCPFHNRMGWREIKLANNGDWEKAIEVDRAIRSKRPGYICYLARQLKPLEDCDFSSPEDHGQLSLWDTEECSGMCFL
ncbi:hypothetical protein KKH13_05230 [Patescibacteria group bacterium]|nr:hypothetical protein [Patescibacteria group bacterium]